MKTIKVFLFCSALLGSVPFVKAQLSAPFSLGSISSFSSSISSSTIGAKILLTTSQGKTIEGTVDINQVSNGIRMVGGKLGVNNRSRFAIDMTSSLVSGVIYAVELNQGYEYYSANGLVYVKQVDLKKLICPPSKIPISLNSANLRLEALPPANDPVFSLNSLPSASVVVKLDFDGEPASYKWYGNVELLPSTMNANEIKELWELVSEDFRPFDINITTSEAVFQATSSLRRIRCVITSTNLLNDLTIGGWSRNGTFSWGGDYHPCLVFWTGAKLAGDAASHEIGHVLGLSHDDIVGNTSNPGYYYGHNDWAPIMGSSNYNLLQWSKGEYANATNSEDDLNRISTFNNIAFRNDDHGNIISNATNLSINTNGDLLAENNQGVITFRTDVDIFRFTLVSSATVSLNFNPSPRHSNLNIEAKLLNNLGATLQTYNPLGLPASMSSTLLTVGTYYIQIDGVGEGASPSVGYSDYGSLGAYSISGTVISCPTMTITGAATVCSNQTAVAYSVINTNGSNYTWTTPASSSVATGSGTNSITINFAGTTAGSRQVQVTSTNSNGCPSQTVTKTITVNPLPVVSGISSKRNILYGTAFGGAFSGTGVIFQYDPVNASYTKKFDFATSASGVQPNGYGPNELTYFNGIYYGTAWSGGANNRGTLFSWNPNANIFIKLLNFDALGANNNTGSLPTGSMVVYNGKLYGVTIRGGSYDSGIIFSYDPSNNTFSRLANFDGINGTAPNSLTLNGSTMYGIANKGGTNNLGTIFAFDPSTNIISKKVDFVGTNGGFPIGSLLLYNNNFYGQTTVGGVNNLGTIFAWTPSTNAFTTSLSVTNTMNNLGNGLIAYNSKLYGTTGGTYGYGSIFSFDPTNNLYSTLATFDEVNTGSYPSAIMNLSYGKLYGTTQYGGANGFGTLFRYDLNNASFAVKYNFTGATGQGSGRTMVGDYVSTDNVICQGTSMNRIFSIGTSTNATSYVWTVPSGATITSGAGTNTITVNFSSTAVSGNVTVKGSGTCGTGAAATYSVTSIPCTNLRQDEEEITISSGQTTSTAFSVYPNPSSGIFNVRRDNQETTNVLVIDMMGNEIYKSALAPNSILQVDLSGKAKGIYHLKVEGTKQSKLINVQ